MDHGTCSPEDWPTAILRGKLQPPECPTKGEGEKAKLWMESDMWHLMAGDTRHLMEDEVASNMRHLVAGDGGK